MNTYKNRISALTTDRTFQLSQEGIRHEGGEWKFNDINRIELKFTPTKYYGGIYQCILHSHFGKEVISNRKYEGPANFTYQNQEFKSFITALHQKLSQVEGVEFSKGLGKASFYIQLIAMLIFMPMVIFAMAAFGQLLIAGIFMLIVLVRLVPFFKKNRPGNYDPLNIPLHLLPT